METVKDSEIAVIGGVGFDLIGQSEVIKTPYGNVEVRFTKIKNQRSIFISRHGMDHIPPHRVNYRAILWAARSCGSKRVISTNTVGTMSYHQLGSFFLPNDFVEFTKSRANTFFEDKAVHVDMIQPYCLELRTCLRDAMLDLNLHPSEGVYVCTEGPHLESPAQIRMMRQFGDVVGMTGYPEVVLAKELGLCYASLCVVTNEACGMKTGGGKLSLSEITEQMDKSSSLVKEILSRTAQKISVVSSCSCNPAEDRN